MKIRKSQKVDKEEWNMMKEKRKEKKKLMKKDGKEHRAKRAATARPERVWDYGVIPYEIESNFSGKYTRSIQVNIGYLII